MWKKEKGEEGGGEEQYKEKTVKRGKGDTNTKIKKMKEIGIEELQTRSNEER